jgi:hypothetical protein
MRDGMRVITAQAYIPGITIGTFKIISSDLGWPKPQKNYPEAAHQIQWAACHQRDCHITTIPNAANLAASDLVFLGILPDITQRRAKLAWKNWGQRPRITSSRSCGSIGVPPMLPWSPTKAWAILYSQHPAKSASVAGFWQTTAFRGNHSETWNNKRTMRQKRALKM